MLVYHEVIRGTRAWSELEVYDIAFSSQHKLFQADYDKLIYVNLEDSIHKNNFSQGQSTQHKKTILNNICVNINSCVKIPL
jgi:hypothetical protein